MTTIPSPLPLFAQTCRKDAYIKEDGTSLGFIDRIKALFDRKLRSQHFLASCQILAAIDFQELQKAAPEDLVVIWGRFREISSKIKDEDVRSACEASIIEFENNAFERIKTNTWVEKLAKSVFEKAASAEVSQDKQVLNQSIRELHVMVDYFKEETGVIEKILIEWSKFSTIKAEILKNRSLFTRVKQFVNSFFFCKKIDAFEAVNNLLKTKFPVSVPCTHQESLKVKAKGLAEDFSTLLQETTAPQVKIGKMFQSFAAPFYKQLMPQHPTYFNEKVGVRLNLPAINKKGYESDAKNVETKEMHARKIHGTLHAARVVLWTQVLTRLYEKEFSRKKIDNPVLLATAAAFHDAAREAEGVDHWDSESAALLSALLKENEGQKEYVQAIREKDPKDNIYSTDIQRIVHDADCLDVMRVRPQGTFDPKYLVFYAFDPSKQDFCQRLIKEVSSFIVVTHDNKLMTYLEHNSEDFYGDLVRLLFAMQEEQQERFPLITSFIQSDMSEIISTKTDASEKAFNLVQLTLEQLEK